MGSHDVVEWLPRIRAGEVLTLRSGGDALVVWRQDGLYLTAENEKLSALPVDAETQLEESLTAWKRGADLAVSWAPPPPTRSLEIPADHPPLLGHGSGGTWHSHFITLDDGRWLECVVLHNEYSDYGACFDTFTTELHTAASAREAIARLTAP